MSEENKAVARRWNRIFEGQASVADEIIAPNIVYHDAPPGIPPGPAGVKAWAAPFSAFAGMQVGEEFYIAEGDIVGQGTIRTRATDIARCAKQHRFNSYRTANVM